MSHAGIPEAATRYLDLRWSVLPIRRGSKRAALDSWKPYQQRRPDREELASWFSDGSTHQLAVVCGGVSGGLVVVDFDDLAYYERWAKAHPDLATKLPTVKTRRGRHIYFRTSHRKTRKLKDGDHEWGEIRAEGAYVLAPPSRHPAGDQYEWLIEPDGDLPYMALDELGLDAALPKAQGEGTEETEDTDRDTEDSEAIGGAGAARSTPEGPPQGGAGVPAPGPAHQAGDTPTAPRWLSSLPSPLSSSVSGSDVAAIERAIRESVPSGAGVRNARVFDLCRALKAIPAVADRPFHELRSIVSEWYQRALPNVRTKDFETTFEDFAHGWGRVLVPKEADFMASILERAKKAPTPACVEKLGMQKLSLLARICVELQRAQGHKPFFLASRKAGELLGIAHARANKPLHILEDIGLVAVAEQGSATRATRYRLTDAAKHMTGLPRRTKEE